MSFAQEVAALDSCISDTVKRESYANSLSLGFTNM